ncbi:hypothetical protein Tco_0611763 [Tanacetum coccineum]
MTGSSSINASARESTSKGQRGTVGFSLGKASVPKKVEGVSKKQVFEKGHLVIKPSLSTPLESDISSSNEAADDLTYSKAGSRQLFLNKVTRLPLLCLLLPPAHGHWCDGKCLDHHLVREKRTEAILLRESACLFWLLGTHVMEYVLNLLINSFALLSMRPIPEPPSVDESSVKNFQMLAAPFVSSSNGSSTRLAFSDGTSAKKSVDQYSPQFGGLGSISLASLPRGQGLITSFSISE